MKKVLLILALIVAGSGLSSAQILVGYNFAGLTGTVTNSDSSQGQVAGAEVFVAPNVNDGSAYNSSTVTATNLIRGSNFGNQVQNSGPPNFTGFFSQNSFGIQPINNAYATTVSSAITAGDYIQLQVSGNGGALSLSSVDFGGGSQGGAGILGLAYSLDGGTTFSTTGIPGGDNGIPIVDYTGGTGDSGHPYLAAVDLSGISALQSVSGTVTLDFFILGTGGYQTSNFTRNASGTASNLDDLQINGVVVVPEPSTWALMLSGLGLLGYLHLRKRRSEVASVSI